MRLHLHCEALCVRHESRRAFDIRCNNGRCNTVVNIGVMTTGQRWVERLKIEERHFDCGKCRKCKVTEGSEEKLRG